MRGRFERAAEHFFALEECLLSSDFQRRGALFERIDLVDQLRFRLAKAALSKCGWIGHMPLLAKRLYLGGFLAEEDVTTPWRTEPNRQGLWSAGNSAHRARMSELGHVPTFGAPRRLVWNVRETRHSSPNVGNVAKISTSSGGR